MRKLKQGFLVAFEGIDGSGKSTQIKMLANVLRRLKIPHITTREPTQGKWGMVIRSFSRTKRLSAEEELDLFIRDRQEHTTTLIKPALEEGKLVLTDRYFYSSAAYQGSLGLDPNWIIQQHTFCPIPDIVFLIDLPAEVGLQRVRIRDSNPPDQFEVLSSLQKCRDLFLEIASDHFVILDGLLEKEDIHQEVVKKTLESVSSSRGQASCLLNRDNNP